LHFFKKKDEEKIGFVVKFSYFLAHSLTPFFFLVTLLLLCDDVEYGIFT